MHARILLLAVALLSGALLPISGATATPSPRLEGHEKRADYAHLNVDEHGLALEGYDPVAYFREGGSKPRKGSAKLSHTVGGVTYRFAEKEHLELFKRDPAKYQPAYGGWCAYAMAKNDKVEVDPESYLVQNGELMLFYKSFFNNTRKSWMNKPMEYKRSADRNWKKIITPEPKPDPATK